MKEFSNGEFGNDQPISLLINYLRSLATIAGSIWRLHRVIEFRKDPGPTPVGPWGEGRDRDSVLTLNKDMIYNASYVDIHWGYNRYTGD